MGQQQLNGSTYFEYNLKTGEAIRFNYYDLKGKSRYPQPARDEISISLLT